MRRALNKYIVVYRDLMEENRGKALFESLRGHSNHMTIMFFL